MRKNYKMDEDYVNHIIQNEVIRYRVCDNCGAKPYDLRGVLHTTYCCNCGVKFTNGDEREDIVKFLASKGFRVQRLKLGIQYFGDVKCGRKDFEIRRNDRNYDIGDILLLEEYDGETHTYKEGYILKRVKYMLGDTQYVREGYVALGLEDFAAPDNIMFT